MPLKPCIGCGGVCRGLQGGQDFNHQLIHALGVCGPLYCDGHGHAEGYGVTDREEEVCGLGVYDPGPDGKQCGHLRGPHQAGTGGSRFQEGVQSLQGGHLALEVSNGGYEVEQVGLQGGAEVRRGCIPNGLDSGRQGTSVLQRSMSVSR